MTSTASLPFVILVFVAASLYSILGKRIRPWLLLVVSLAFYGSFNLQFLYLLLAVIGVTFLAGLSVHHHPDKRWQVPLWVLAILSPLLFYKYFLAWFSGLLETFIPVSELDFGTYGAVLIPVGLSFFTFQCLAYVIDLSNKEFEPERNPFRFTLFVAFFPQLLAGPIERWLDLSKQIFKAERPSPEMVLDGLQLLAYGLFMKLVLGDWLGFYVDNAYAVPADNSSAAAFLGLYGFTLQIYADFCGYSLVAVGSARLFGVRLTMNFQQPFFARNIVEFWRRWHISLTRWIGDYVYRPIGFFMLGHKSLPRFVKEGGTVCVTWVTMAMWHGATWPFVVLGVCQAGLFMVHGYWARWRHQEPTRLGSIFSGLLTFHVIVLTFTLARSPTMADYINLWSAALALTPGGVPFTGVTFNIIVGLVIVLTVDACRRFFPEFRLRSLFARTASIGILIILAILMGHDETKTFIYFRF